MPVLRHRNLITRGFMLSVVAVMKLSYWLTLDLFYSIRVYEKKNYHNYHANEHFRVNSYKFMNVFHNLKYIFLIYHQYCKVDDDDIVNIIKIFIYDLTTHLSSA